MNKKNKEFFEDLKFPISLDIQEQQKIRLKKRKQIELIYRMKTKKREECHNAELKSIVFNNVNELDNGDDIYISDLELLILNDIAISYQFQHEYGHMFSAELNGFIDGNICDIVEKAVQDAKDNSKDIQNTFPEYYEKQINTIGETNFLLECRTNNIYQTIVDMKKEKDNKRNNEYAR